MADFFIANIKFFHMADETLSLLNYEMTEEDKEMFEKTWETVNTIPIRLTESQKPLVKRMLQIAYFTGILVGLKKNEES